MLKAYAALEDSCLVQLLLRFFLYAGQASTALGIWFRRFNGLKICEALSDNSPLHNFLHSRKNTEESKRQIGLRRKTDGLKLNER